MGGEVNESLCPAPHPHEACRSWRLLRRSRHAVPGVGYMPSAIVEILGKEDEHLAQIFTPEGIETLSVKRLHHRELPL